jgi:hypothetical protein
MKHFVPLLIALTPAAALAATPSGPPANLDPKIAAQVPVIAAKLKGWQGQWGAAGGKLACRTVRSTGDDAIDMIGCAALVECVTPAYPALKTIADGKDAVEVKKKKIAAKLATLNPCLSQKRGLGIARLAVQRARAAGG